ncbi:MAG: ATP-binding protein [Streptosporangiaceae bacterium]|jgi:anti-sigma regulatory factor (Ser/Thr protein kinase)
MMAPVRTIVERPYRISLLAGPAAAAQARRHVGAIIRAWDLPVDDYTAALLTSELVTNAILHASDEHESIELVISWGAGLLRVEVHDGSRSAPARVHALPYAEAGRGLMLLESLSSSWGSRETARGKAVYFTLAP